MADRVFIVDNPEGLLVRSKPDTNTGAGIRKMTNGEGFQVFDVITQGNRTWARVSRGDSVQQEYACIAIGNRIFAREQSQSYISVPASEWQLAVDAFLRTKGYTGPRP